jgi:glutathione S-transferase
LFGKTAKDKALVNQWLEVESQNYNPCVSSILYQVLFAPMQGRQTDETLVKQQLEKLEKVLDIYEAHLSKNKYLAGDFFSLADLSHIPCTYYLVDAAKKGDGITSRKHVSAWWEDISSRASWKTVTAMMKPKA